MKKLYPMNCINANCNKIIYVEKHELGLCLQCKKCIKIKQEKEINKFTKVLNNDNTNIKSN